MDETSTSMRTGIEPFFLLNSIWVVGSSRTSINLSCVGELALSLVTGNTNTSPPITIFGPRPTIVQPYSLPGVWPAAMNSPLAQSPLNCMAALLVITSEVASFQLRPGLPGSTSPRNLPKTSTVSLNFGSLHRFLVARCHRLAEHVGAAMADERRRGTGCAPTWAGRRARSG